MALPMKVLLIWLGRLIILGALIFGAFSAWLWAMSEEHSVQSLALNEDRVYRIFNKDADGPAVYLLDGQSLRNSLAPAVIFSLAAMLKGQDTPKLIAVYSGQNRDRDFREYQSTPTYWRPQIMGHARKFDEFLLKELPHKISGEPVDKGRNYLLGHSLAGLYVLDLAAREPAQFKAVFSFAPTFSHDTSIANRLSKACVSSMHLYANWGLESARDTAIFETVVERWKRDPACQNDRLFAPRHYGAVHQVVMLTGQIDAAFRLYETGSSAY